MKRRTDNHFRAQGYFRYDNAVVLVRVGEGGPTMERRGKWGEVGERPAPKFLAPLPKRLRPLARELNISV